MKFVSTNCHSCVVGALTLELAINRIQLLTIGQYVVYSIAFGYRCRHGNGARGENGNGARGENGDEPSLEDQRCTIG